MAVTAQQLAAELRAFDGRRAVVQAARRGIMRAVPSVRDRIRSFAVANLPSSGGLGRWVAAARVSVQIRYAGRSAGVRLRGARKSARNKSDLTGIDAGRVRAPSWGHRTAASWHSQTVTPGWFTQPAGEDRGFRDHVDAEIDLALDTIRRG
jgi:hypothetical protein